MTIVLFVGQLTYILTPNIANRLMMVGAVQQAMKQTITTTIVCRIFISVRDNLAPSPISNIHRAILSSILPHWPILSSSCPKFKMADGRHF